MIKECTLSSFLNITGLAAAQMREHMGECLTGRKLGATDYVVRPGCWR